MGGVTAFFYILLSLWVQDAAAIIGFTRSDFAQDFVFGAGTSAYQYEGAVAEDGRSPSFWDTFTHAGKMPDKSTGDIAADGYHKYKEDLKLISETGLEAYRFSISWSRLIPNGRGAVNPKGLEYYNNIIDELVKHGIQIHITLHHVDLPQILADEYGGWLSSRIMLSKVVGINIYSFWSYPFTNSSVDLKATQRAKDFIFGWMLEPLVFGDYPEVMKNIVGSRLPSFTKVQSVLIKDSFDFFGINHYYSLYVNDRPIETDVRDFNADMSIYYRASRTGPPAGQGT